MPHSNVKCFKIETENLIGIRRKDMGIPCSIFSPFNNQKNFSANLSYDHLKRSDWLINFDQQIRGLLNSIAKNYAENYHVGSNPGFELE